jgi:hypothetical protein
MAASLCGQTVSEQLPYKKRVFTAFRRENAKLVRFPDKPNTEAGVAARIRRRDE